MANKPIEGIEFIPLLSQNNEGMISFNRSKKQTVPIEVDYAPSVEKLIVRFPASYKMPVHKETRISILMKNTEDNGTYLLIVSGTCVKLETGEEKFNASTAFNDSGKNKKDYEYIELFIERIEKEQNN